METAGSLSRHCTGSTTTTSTGEGLLSSYEVGIFAKATGLILEIPMPQTPCEIAAERCNGTRLTRPLEAHLVSRLLHHERGTSTRQEEQFLRNQEEL